MSTKNQNHFVNADFDICAICHKVTKCHELIHTDDEIIVVCGICELE